MLSHACPSSCRLSTLYSWVASALMSSLPPPWRTCIQTLQHPLVGCATALDTLLAQSYGARQYDAYGAWTQTGLLVLLAMCVPFMVLLAVAEPVLLATGVERSLAVRAARFDLALIPGVPPSCSFLASPVPPVAEHPRRPLWIAAIANAINVLVNYGLIFGLGWVCAERLWPRL